MMTVADLIAALTPLDPDLPVSTAGCDCVEPAHHIEVTQTWVPASDIPGSRTLMLTLGVVIERSPVRSQATQ